MIAQTIAMRSEKAYNVDSKELALTDEMRAYLEMRRMWLMHEVNWIRRQLGENPKRCPHCGDELK